MIIKTYHLVNGTPVRTDVDVNEWTYWIVRRKLESERIKILNILRDFKEKQIIKSIRRPTNKKIQPYLNELVKAKQEINKSIEKLMILFS